jgi:hypothetical protein
MNAETAVAAETLMTIAAAAEILILVTSVGAAAKIQ